MKLYSVVFALSFGSAVACDGLRTDYDNFKYIQSIVQGSDCDVRYTKHENHMEMSCGQYRMHFQFEEGNGKYQGMMGAIICESEDGKIKVSVGSGFSDSERKEFFDNKMIGKIVSVRYNSRIQNKNGSESLFLPIFLEIRYDKTSADLEESVK